MEPKISVVIPLYNKCGTILRALHSILNQESAPDEVIVVDDGSSDDGARIALSAGDARIKVIRQENAGPSSARNRGVAESRNELIAFLDADDEWLPSHLRALEDLKSAYPDAGLWATTWSRSDDSSGKRDGLHAPARVFSLKEYLKAVLGGDRIVCTSSILTRKSLLLKTGGFPEGKHHGEDQALWLKIALEKPIVNCKAATAIYHIQPESLSNKLVIAEDACMLAIQGILREGTGLDGEDRNLLSELGNRFALGHALGALRNGNPQVAGKFLRMAKDSKRYANRRRILRLLAECESFVPGLTFHAVSTRRILRRLPGLLRGTDGSNAA